MAQLMTCELSHVFFICLQPSFPFLSADVAVLQYNHKHAVSSRGSCFLLCNLYCNHPHTVGWNLNATKLDLSFGVL